MIGSRLLDQFSPISLEEMGKVRLMNRTDTKFVTNLGRLLPLLEIASEDYLIQEIDGRRNMPYYTCYYDTSSTLMYYEHERGKKNRQKIRIRIYEGNEMPPFLEIKNKNNRGRTRKKRIEMKDGCDLLTYSEFISNNLPYPPSLLLPQIENHFYRITLVNPSLTERITIDTGLEFHNLSTSNRKALTRLGIIEWKRDGRCFDSRLEYLLRELRIHQSGFSKYCVGMALTNPGIRQNRLKAKIRLAEKMNELRD